MTLDQHYDVIIIGTGAGGGTLARHLAPSGKRILLIERGDFLAREKQNWDPHEIMVKRRYVSQDTWFDGRNKPFHPETYYYVGGNTKVYGTVLFRFRKEDFRELKHHGGLSPAWPLSYDDLEPYYTKAEQLYGVHGQRGTDPTEPEASAPYPFPPVSHEPKVQELVDGFERVGCHPFHMPLGVMLNERDAAHSQCLRCGTCDNFPCLVHAKSDAEVVGVRPALAYSNVTLMTNSRVTRLATSASGREVTDVIVDHNGVSETYRANIVVVAAGAINSAKLLLMSANDKHPRGLANRSDHLGRNLMLHNLTVMIAFSTHVNPTVFQKTLAINDFYFGMDGFNYPAGNIQMMSKTSGDTYRKVMPRVVPRSLLTLLSRHAFEFLLTTEDLPNRENRITIEDNDRVKVNFTPNNLEPMRQLTIKLKRLLKQMKGPFTWCHCSTYRVPLAGVGHQSGTCRFGNDPLDSVLDANCKAHDLDNLYVVDASFFPSCAALNPALTIMANALRVGDRILERL